MDPLTAAINLATAITNVYTTILEGASKEQKEKLVDLWIEDQKFWRGLIERLTPKDATK
jgi:hypothetical protein